MRYVDRDLDCNAPTMFELTDRAVGALSVIKRGLPPCGRIGEGLGFAVRAAFTHFRGHVDGWLDIDRDVAGTLADRIKVQRPEFVFAALTGIDKSSHSTGHASPQVNKAMKIVDETVAMVRANAERDGTWDAVSLWIVSDHGHSPVHHHDDLASVLRAEGVKTLAHPWAFGGAHHAAVMVSGNAMAHLYFDVGLTQRPFWNGLTTRSQEHIDALLRRPSVDIAVVPHSATHSAVRTRDRGDATIVRSNGHFSYHPQSGDPLGIGELDRVSADAAFDATRDCDYPDSVVQIAHLAGSARSGDVILSAARDWDFRDRYEPIRHVSSHGALHREHMLVPLITNRPFSGTPRRTVDVMPSALAALGKPIPPGLDGSSFI